MKLSLENKKRHFCSTAFIIDNDRILLVNHKKQKMWLPIGGHIEENETPDQAVEREVKEETGLDIEIIGEKYPEFDTAEILNRPFLVALQHIDDEHQHIDLQYICRIKGNKKLGWTEECRWFTEDELDDLEKCPLEIKHFAKEAIRTVKDLK